MTRVSSLGQNQALLAEMLRNQSRIEQTQYQISTGKVSRDYAGLGADARSLLDAKAVETRLEQQIATARQSGTRVEQHTAALGTLRDEVEALQEALFKAVSAGSGMALMEQAEALFERVVQTLNSRVEGQYAFAGTRTDTPPLTVATVDDLMALPADLSGAFADGDARLTAAVDEGLSVAYGERASEVGGEVLSVLREVLRYNAGLDAGGTPLQGTLSQDQQDFLLGQVERLKAANADLIERESAAGIAARTVKDAETRHIATRDATRLLISDIEDVDAAEAVTRLNADRTALQVSYQLYNRISQLSLAEFLR